MTAKSRITQKAVELLTGQPEGLRHAELLSRLRAILPDIPVNTIRGTLVGLAEHGSDAVFKPGSIPACEVP